MSSKLFGNSSGSKFAAGGAQDQAGDSHVPKNRREHTVSADKQEPGKKKRRFRGLKILLSVLLVLELLYCLAIFTNIPVIEKLRTMYIKTAMSTMSHQWLATAFIPKDIVDEVVVQTEQAKQDQIGLESTWGDVTEPPVTEPTEPPVTEPTEPLATESTEPTEPPIPQGQTDFFELFYELDQTTVFDYVEEHPEAVENGWDKFYVNEAGLEDDGTTMMTTKGDSVLAIDMENQVMLLRVTGSTYRGVLAIAKDPGRLSVELSSQFGKRGERAGEIASAHGGILAITASGFDDPEGGGNGGRVTGATVSHGVEYGRHFGSGYKRIELRNDNRMYIVDAYKSTHEDTRDASEFWPALVVDGESALKRGHIFTEMNPRACLGQARDGSVLMLVIEGRFLNSLGTDAEGCVDILLRYDCYQGMNMDGGTSAIMWYQGEYVTRCSNTRLDEGRNLPNAWVYKGVSE